MRIIRLNEEALEEDILEQAGVTFAIYYYQCEGYEGYGKCLAYQNDKWYTCDLGHCSCYGPFDGYPEHGPFDTVKEAIVDLHSMDWSKDFVDVIQKMADKATKNVS